VIKSAGNGAHLQNIVSVALGIALLLAVIGLIVRQYLTMRQHSAHRAKAAAGETRADGSTADQPIKVKRLATVLLGAVGGLVVGMTSVGSGSLIIVVLLALYPKLRAGDLVGTDLVQAVPLVLAAAVGHVLTEGVTWAVLIPLVLGGTPGTFLGAKMAAWVSQSVIRRGIVIVLSITGLKMLGVPPEVVGLIGAGLLLLGPLAWGFLRQRRGIPAFDNNAAAWRLPD
jgi:uncharacterized membrane protein YfcA